MVTWIIAVVVGVVTGMLSGMGIGGGTLLVLYLTTVRNTTASVAAGINLLYFICCAPASLFFHAKGGLIDRNVAISAAIGGVITAFLAALFVPTPSPDWLRRLFGAFLLVVGSRELWLVFHTEKKRG